MGIGIWASGRPSRAEPATGQTFHESQTLERNQEAPLPVGLPPGDSRSGREDERGDRDRLGNAAAAAMTPPIAAASAADDTYRRLRRDGSGGRGRLCEGDAKGRIHFRILGPTRFLESLNQLGPRVQPNLFMGQSNPTRPFCIYSPQTIRKTRLASLEALSALGLTRSTVRARSGSRRAGRDHGDPPRTYPHPVEPAAGGAHRAARG